MRADLARLQGEKAEAEARVERERSEKNKALLEKEQFRAHVHHLARALRVSQSASQTASQPASQSCRSHGSVNLGASSSDSWLIFNPFFLFLSFFSVCPD